MSGARGKSPLRGKWGGIKKQLGSEAFASPIDREQVSGQMQDIFSTVKKLRVSHPLRPSPRAQWLGAGKGDGGLRAGVAVVWHRCLRSVARAVVAVEWHTAYACWRPTAAQLSPRGGEPTLGLALSPSPHGSHAFRRGRQC